MTPHQFGAGQVTGPAEPIQKADGTITFMNTFKGLPEKVSIAGGPTLSRDAGVATLGTTFRPLPNGDLEFVSQTFYGNTGRTQTWKAVSSCSATCSLRR
jgi:hypothetical protein